MMRFSILGIIICQIAVQPQAEKFHNRFPQKTSHHHDRETFEVTESRFRSNRDFSNYDNRITSNSYDIPVTFKAPHYEAHDYWKNNRDYYTQRTFFEDYGHAHPTKTTTAFPGLYQFMSSIFGVGTETDSEYPEGYHYQNRITPPHKPVTPYGFNPTEPNYIPPPKPIRASVIKLETITRSPVYPPYDYETTTKYYPHVGTILNHVLIENSKAQRNATWHSEDRDERVLPFKPLPHHPLPPVLPKPAYPRPTTLKPNYPEFFSNFSHGSLHYPSQTDYKYPESVQDQLPHINLGEVEIPYVSEKPIPQIFIPSPTPPPRKIGFAAGFFPPTTDPATNHLNPSYIRSLNHPRKIVRPSGINPEMEMTSVKSFPGAVEKVSRPTFKYSRKLTAQLEKSQAERVANLTVLGFSMEIPKERKRVNYSNIDQSTGNIKNTSWNDSSSNSSMRQVNLNDELSLDAKILKDTNWDGLTVSPESITGTPKEFTTITQQVEPRIKQNVTAFWEITETPTTTSSTEYDSTETTEQIKIQTTTEFIFWTSTTETPETNSPAIIQETTPRKISLKAQNRSESSSEDSLEPGKENLERREVTIRPERTITRRKYNKRPKTVNFTQYPTMEELQRKLINRNNFPKRQKPNLTLAFGNKNVLKVKQSSGAEEVMKFSDEDVRRRKIGKRRQVYKRIRTSTSEPPNQSDQS